MRLLLIVAILLAGCSRPEAGPKELYNQLLNVRALAFSPDGSVLVAGRNKGSEGSGDLLIWEQGGEGVMKTVPAHDHDVVGVLFSGPYLISAGYDGELKEWQTSSWNVTSTIKSTRWIQTITDRGGWLEVLRAGGRQTYQPGKAEVQLWDKGELKASIPVPGATNMVIFDHGLATVMTDSKVVFWEKFTRVRELNVEATALDVSPDFRTLAVGGADGVVRLFNWAGAETGTLPALPKRITAVRYAPDGRLAYACEEHLVLSANGQVTWDRPVEEIACPAVLAFSPDGKRLASAGPAKVLLWNL